MYFLKKIKKPLIFLSVLSLALELNIFQAAGSGIKLWMLAAIAGGLLLLWDLYKNGFAWLKQSKILWLGAGLILFSALGIINSPLKSYSFKQLIVLATIIVLGVFFEMNLKKYRRETYMGLLIGILISSIYAIYQNIAFDLGITNFEVMAARPNAFFPEPDWLGMYFALGLVPFLVYVRTRRCPVRERDSALACPEPVERFLQNKYFIYSLTLMGITALIITVARASWLALIGEMGIILMLCFYQACRNRTTVLFERGKSLFLQSGYFFSLIVVSLVLINIFHLSRFNIPDRFRSIFLREHIVTLAVKPETEEKIKINLEEKEAYRNQGYQIQEEYADDENVASREEKVISTWDTIRKHPILGNGLGITLINTNYQHNANNLFLEWWASAGLGGLGLIVGLIVYLLGKGLLLFKDNPRRAALVLAGTIGFIIVNLFNASIFLAFAWFFLALMITSSNKAKFN